MVNETILDYNSVIEVTQHPIIIIALIIIWLFPLAIYVTFGFVMRARTGDGRIIPRTKMIQTKNFWIGFFIWFVFQGGLIIALLIFPSWMKLI